jgi:hypothetical protein
MNNNIGDGVTASVRGSNEGTRDGGQGRFVTGLAAGAILGVGIGLWLSPRSSTLRQWLDESARVIGAGASELYAQAADPVAAAVDGKGTAQSEVPPVAHAPVTR